MQAIMSFLKDIFGSQSSVAEIMNIARTFKNELENDYRDTDRVFESMRHLRLLNSLEPGDEKLSDILQSVREACGDDSAYLIASVPRWMLDKLPAKEKMKLIRAVGPEEKDPKRVIPMLRILVSQWKATSRPATCWQLDFGW